MDDDAERARLVELLHELGATDEEVAAAFASGAVGGLGLELVLRTGQTETFRACAERHGVPLEKGARYWRALGFPDPDPDTTPVAADLADAWALIAFAGEALLGEEGTLALARVVGSSTARIAQAVVDTFRARFEVPQLAEGRPYPEVFAEYVALTRDVLPPFVEAMGAVLRRHLVATAADAWSSDDERTTTRRRLAVGFIDLVGYTSLARTLSPGELGSLVNEFEAVVTDAAARGRGRVVKLIGDAAMFTADDPAAACLVALDVVEAAARSTRLPSLRGGLAYGEAVALQGDVFGEVVNLAARLVAVAPEGAVLVDEQLRAAAGGGVAFTAMAPRRLKGFGTPAVAYVVSGAAPADAAPVPTSD